MIGNSPPPLPTILFEDPHLVVVDKPAGVPTQATASGEPGIDQAIRSHLSADPGAAVYLGTVHRLDRPVGGVLVWAKTPKAARRLSEQFSGREASKEYWAIVEGVPETEAGTWEDHLAHDDDGNGRYARVVGPGSKGARRASTRYELGRAAGLPGGCSFLRLRPETGRTHQLRVQASARGLSIVGDRIYGSSRSFPVGIALLARRLEVRHPISGLPLGFEAPLPTAWAESGIVILDS